MASSDEKIYPTDEDLFITHSSSLPIVSYRNTSSTDSSSSSRPQLNELDNTIGPLRGYADNQIIPWRKLYSKKRIDDQALLSSGSLSPLTKLFLKYNKWPILISSSIIITVVSIGLDWSLTWLSNLKFGYCKGNFFSVQESCPQDQWQYYFSHLNVFVSVILGFILLLIMALIYANIGLLLSKNNLWTHQSGISELHLIISGKVNNAFFKPDVILRKYGSLIFICASGGLLVGFEGPLVHISCGIIHYIIEIASSKVSLFNNLNNEAVKREIVSIGFVIGISLAFGAPIGGLLFSAENLNLGTKLNSLMWNGFVCSSIATFLLFKFHPFKKVEINEAFKVEIGNGWILFETIPYLFVGLLCGLLALVYIKLHMKILDYKKALLSDIAGFDKLRRILQNPFLEISCLVTITWLLLYPINFSHLTLNDIMRILFRDCVMDNSSFLQELCSAKFKIFEMLYCFAIIFIQSNYAYSLSIPGGILLPSLTLGAFIGRIIGEIVQMIQAKAGSDIFLQCYTDHRNCVSPGSYAIVGAASFFAGVTNTSVAAVVIVFELTGAVTYLIPLMLGVAVSKSLVDLFDSKSFYELWLTKTNGDYVSPELSESLRLSKFSKVTLSQIIGDYVPDVIYNDGDQKTTRSLIQRLESVYDHYDGTDIVNDGFVILESRSRPILLGWVSYHDLLEILKAKDDGTDREVALIKSNKMRSDYVDLTDIVIPSRDLFIVNQNYSVLTAFDLMTQMKITNLFIATSGEVGEQFKAILRMAELSKVLNK